MVVGSDGTERPHQLHAVLSAQSAVGGGAALLLWSQPYLLFTDKTLNESVVY